MAEGSKVRAVYLARITLREDEKQLIHPPTNEEVNKAIERLELFEEFDVNVDAERVDQ